MDAAEQDFTCNICGTRNTCVLDAVDREARTCSSCESSIRLRSLILVLTRELFGSDAPLPQLPIVKSIRGLGISDSNICSSVLEKVFDYQNTYYHKDPHFDLLHPDPDRIGKYDFVICSEVLEHVPPPAEAAFRALASVLKPKGVLILTVPYFPGPDTIEHFPGLHEFGFADVKGSTVLVNRTAEGKWEVFDQLCFHGGPGSTLEMRIFSEPDLRAALKHAGLGTVVVHTTGSPEYGVSFSGPCSLPISARSVPFSLNVSGLSEIVGQYLDLHRTLDSLIHPQSPPANLQAALETDAPAESLGGELTKRTEWALALDAERTDLTERYNTVARSAWVRLGRRLGLVPRT